MISVDMHAGLAWQRCWDAQDCVEVGVHGRKVKAKRRLPRPPPSALPTLAALDEFEASTDHGTD